MGNRAQLRITEKMKLCEYLSSEFDNLDQVDDEQDMLLLKRAQIKCLYYYKLWNRPFIVVCGLVMLRNSFNRSRPLAARLLVNAGVAPLCYYGAYYVG